VIDEILDVVDQNDKVIGTEKRSVVHQTGVWHRGIHIFVFNPNGKLVVQMRGKDQDKYPSALDCSVSEHLQFNENYLNGALRGLNEELGLNISANKLRPLVKFKMRYGDMDNMISKFFEIKLESEMNVTISPEGKPIYYYEIQELTKMIHEGSAPFSYWFTQLLCYYTEKPCDMEIIEKHLLHQQFGKEGKYGNTN